MSIHMSQLLARGGPPLLITQSHLLTGAAPGKLFTRLAPCIIQCCTVHHNIVLLGFFQIGSQLVMGSNITQFVLPKWFHLPKTLKKTSNTAKNLREMRKILVQVGFNSFLSWVSANGHITNQSFNVESGEKKVNLLPRTDLFTTHEDVPFQFGK